MNKKELIEAIQFIIEWGINDDDYIQKNFRQYLIGGECSDNSIELAHEHKEHLQIVDNVESHLNQLINSAVEEEQKRITDWIYINLPMSDDITELVSIILSHKR